MASSLFPILDVQAPRDRDEPIGSKAKFWFKGPIDGSLWLFKAAREGTGEDWAEKVAAELAGLLGLPHAVVELAHHEGVPGIATEDFTDGREILVHGNELLFFLDPAYPKEHTYRVPQHTLEAVRRVLDRPLLSLPGAAWPDPVTTPWDAFIGYLMLDALIGNTDRHHQNWGLLVERTGVLAPTFDHASSLGRELSDDQRTRRLETKDTRGDFSAYAAKTRSALYAAGESEPLSPCDAFLRAALTRPDAGRAWLERLGKLAPDAPAHVIDRVPGPAMSDPARRFALALLSDNRNRLQALHVP